MEARQLLKEYISPSVKKVVAEELVQKWNRLLEGITDENRKMLTAVLLEQTKRGLEESANSISSADVAAASRYIFPLVRRVWPGLVVNDIVAVQPMTMPVGAVCYFQVLYGSNKGPVQKGDEIPPNLSPEYSSDTVTGEVVGQGNGENTTFKLSYIPVNRGTLHLTLSGTPPTVLVDKGDGKLYNSDDEVMATIDYDSGTIVFEEAPGNGVTLTANYRYIMELTATIPEIELKITFEEIMARARKLKATWSPEAMEDMKALYAVDAEAEIVQQISSAIALEIDQEVIQDLYNAVDKTSELYTTWDRRPPQGVPDIWHIQSLVHAISKISNIIHKKTYRAPANWIIVSPEIASLIEMIPQFKADETQKGELKPISGIQRIGTLSGRWIVFKNPYFNRQTVLVGYKGTVFYDTGYVYAPYIPLQATPTFYDPETFAMKKGLRTRYAKKLVRREYYGLVEVTNL